MDHSNFARTLRNAFASLFGYPPVMNGILTRRLEG